MKKHIKNITVLFIFILLLNCQKSKAIDLPPFQITVSDNPAPGYLFLAPISMEYITLLDNIGKPVYSKIFDVSTYNYDLKVQPNGMLTYYDFNKLKFYGLDKNFAVIDSFQCVGYETDAHDILILPNGNTILIGKDIREETFLSLLLSGTNHVQVIGNVIQEIDKQKNVVFQWSTFDHFSINDYLFDDEILPRSFDWTHINSMDIDSLGNLIISSRHLDEVTKIDRKTGNIIWRWGGQMCKNNEFKFINDNSKGFKGFSHQHDVRILPNGNILMFDNGNMKPKPYSRAVEYKLDENKRIATMVWQYRRSPDVYTMLQGSTQRLSNGNTLICWGTTNNGVVLTEARPDGSIAYEMLSNDITPYRAFRFVYKMDALMKNIIIPGNFNYKDSINECAVNIEVNDIIKPGRVSVERHYYKPVDFPKPINNIYDIYPQRWVIKTFDSTEINGRLVFNLSSFDNDFSNKSFELLFRKKEGTGSFEKLETVYQSDKHELISHGIRFGEYCISSSKSTGISLFKQQKNNFVCYPNPVNDLIKFEYKLCKSGDASIKIYNLLGIEVAALLLKIQSIENNNVDWDASALPAGTYLCRFNSGDCVSTFYFIKN